MAAEPRIYRWDDPGAPQPSNDQNAFYEVAKGVLVDGYGSHLPAGWSMVYDEWLNHGHAQFTNVTGSGVLGLVKDDSNGPDYFDCSIFVADAMADATTAINARSGSVAIPDITDITANTSRMGLRDSQHWVAIANENVAIFWVSNTASYLTTPNGRSGGVGFVLVVGALDSLRGLGSIAAPNPGNFFAVGGIFSTYSGKSWDGNEKVTTLRASDGAITTTAQYGLIWPYCEDAYKYIGVSSSDSVVELTLLPVELWTSSSTTQGYFYQVARAPMLLSSLSFTGAGNSSTKSNASYFTDRLGTGCFNLLSLAGKSCVIAPLPRESRIVVSMELEDWV